MKSENREKEMKMESSRGFRGEDPWTLKPDFDRNG
jgi:hypothetical protein